MPKDTVDQVDIWEVTRDMQRILADHTKLLLDQYRIISGMYNGRGKVLMDAVLEYWPEGAKKFFESFDIWLTGEAQMYQKNMAELLEDYATTVSGYRFSAPNLAHYKMLVAEHTSLWLNNYEKLKKRRDQVNADSIQSLKTMFPPAVHPIIDNANRWMVEQNERMEEQMLERIRKFARDAEGLEE